MNIRSTLIRLVALSLLVSVGISVVNSTAYASPSSLAFFNLLEGWKAVSSAVNPSFPRGTRLEVLQVNAVPSAVDDTATLEEDVSTKINVTINDSTGDFPHNLAVESAPTYGTASVNGKDNITYGPGQDYYGTDSFVYRLCDKDGECSSAMVTVTITPVNDPPNPVDDSASTQANTPVNVPVLDNDSDVENDVLLLQSFDTTSAQGGTISRFDNNTGGDLSDDQVTYAPASNFTGTDVFTYTVSDGLARANAQVTVTVSGLQNGPPSAGDDNYTTPKNTPLNVGAASGVLSNDNDPDGDLLTAVLDIGPSNGGLILNADGSFTYTPNVDFAGQDTFAYHANDGVLDSNAATVTINVQDGNFAPVASDDAYDVPINNALTVSAPGVLVNDNDPDGDPLTAVLETGPANGSVALSNDGSFSYTPAANFFGTDTFTYRANDGLFSSNLATVTIQVLEGNVAPVAGNDSYSTLLNQSLSVSVPGVLVNDSDFNGDSLTAVLDDKPDHGTLMLNPDGSFNYTPGADFVGVDTFRYRASDGSMESDIAEVTLSVLEADTESPTVNWLSPVSDEETFTVHEESIIRLEASATDNSGIASVRFYRWDAVNETNVEIGIVYAAPYFWDLEARTINWGFNQINAKAYDIYGNESASYIWLTKLRRVYLPLMTR